MPHFLFIFIRHAGFATADSEALSRPANAATHPLPAIFPERVDY
jgi:hypothetical protein